MVARLVAWTTLSCEGDDYPRDDDFNVARFGEEFRLRLGSRTFTAVWFINDVDNGNVSFFLFCFFYSFITLCGTTANYFILRILTNAFLHWEANFLVRLAIISQLQRRKIDEQIFIYRASNKRVCKCDGSYLIIRKFRLPSDTGLYACTRVCMRVCY